MSAEKNDGMSLSVGMTPNELDTLLNGGELEVEEPEVQLPQETEAELPQEEAELPQEEEAEEEEKVAVADAEEAVPSESSFVADLTNQLAVKLGVGLLDDDGKPYEFESSQDGLVEGIQVIAELHANIIIDKFITKNQLVLDFFNHVEAGNDPAAFFVADQAKYSELDYSDEDVASGVLSKFLQSKGLEEEYISAMVEKVIGDGKLEEKARNAGEQLDRQSGEKRAANEKLVADRNAGKMLEEKKTLEEIDRIVSTGKLLGNQLASTEVKKFREFLTVKDASGTPARVSAWEKLTSEERLYLNYLVYSGFKPAKAKSVSTIDAFSQAAKANASRADLSGSTTKKAVRVAGNNLVMDKSEFEKLLE